MAKGLFMPALESGIDLSDTAQLDAYVQDYNDRLPEAVPSTGPSLELPPVRLAPRADLAAAAEASCRLKQVRDLVGWVAEGPGQGRALTQTGRLKLADARELIALLETGDVMDPAIGDRTFKTSTSEELYQLNLIFEWAKRARLARVTKGRLVPVKAAAKLLEEDPLGLWERLWEVFEELADTMIRGRISSMFAEEYDSGLRAILLALLQNPAPLELLRLVAWSVVSEPYVLDGGPREAMWRQSVDWDVKRVIEELAALGVLDTHPLDANLAGLLAADGLELDKDSELAELTPLGTWAAFQMMRAEGAEVKSFDDLAAADLKELITATAELGPDNLTAALAAWITRRDTDTAAGELIALVRESRDPVLRMGAGEGLTLLGQSATKAVRALAADPDPAVGGYARFWLIGQGEEPAEAVRPQDAAYQGIDQFAALLRLAPAPQIVSELLPPGQERLLEEFSKIRHPELEQVLHTLGEHHPDKKTAKAARKLLFKAKSRK
jgi:hypothetical protein